MTYPVMMMKTIMESYQHSKIDVLRLPVATRPQWKTLKNLINTGAIQDIRQLSLNIAMEDDDMWEEYRCAPASRPPGARRGPDARAGCAQVHPHFAALRRLEW